MPPSWLFTPSPPTIVLDKITPIFLSGALKLPYASKVPLLIIVPLFTPVHQFIPPVNSEFLLLMMPQFCNPEYASMLEYSPFRLIIPPFPNVLFENKIVPYFPISMVP